MHDLKELLEFVGAARGEDGSELFGNQIGETP
jgi:hypothetical protein